MYTIKQAALRSGLTIATVRAWERRYGVVQPGRTAAGYRLYDDEAIERLTAMRRLVEVDGMQPSQAAVQVREGGANVAEHAPGSSAEVRRDGPAAGAPTVRAILDIRDAARRMDIAMIERVLDETFAAERFEAATTNVVYPALRAIGEEWATGTIDVAMEHAASETIRRRLARFYDAVLDLSSSFDVIVGLPPGCQHEIGAMGFAVAARRRGLRVLYLGANVPVASWVRTIQAVETLVDSCRSGQGGRCHRGPRHVVTALSAASDTAGDRRRRTGRVTDRRSCRRRRPARTHGRCRRGGLRIGADAGMRLS